MNQPVYPLKVVVASPGDVQPERDALPAVFEELNRGIAAERGLRLELIRWETDAHPGFDPDGPQGLIDPLLRIEDCDVLIGIFWKRFGTPVKDADSGTEHEFRLAYKAWKETGRPQIFVYFNHQPYAPKSAAEVEQWHKVLAFKESFPTEGLWWGYEGATDFERKVRQHLTNFIRQLPKPGKRPRKNPSQTLSAKKAVRSNAELFQAYRDRLAEKVSRVRLLGEDQSRPLEKVFVKLNIVEDYQRPPHDAEFLGLLDARMRQRQRLFSRDEQEETPGMPGERAGKTRRTLSPDELLRGNLKAIITGSPGSGKTTLARWLTRQELQHEDHLPVFLELKTISARAFDEADGDLVELIFNRELAQPLDLNKAEQQHLSAAFRERLRKGEATIILDGLDEVSGTDYFKRLCAAVNGFNAKYRQCRLLITTRPYALQTRFDNLKEMEIAPLNDRQIAEFLDYYFGQQEQWQEFQRELKRRRDLRELARVPVLLGFIIQLWQLWREQGAVSGNRLELYQKIVQALVVRLDEEKNIERKFQVVDPDGALKRDFLRHLAFARMFDDRVQRDAERLVFTGEQIEEEAKRFRDAERLDLNQFHLAADVKKTPLLREVGDDQWAFTHLTLQEYLAATTLARHEDRARIFCRAYFNPRLAEMEVLPIALAAAKPPDALYEALAQLPDSLTFTSFRLRLRGLVYGTAVSQPLLEKLTARLIEIISGQRTAEKLYEGIILRGLSGVRSNQAEYICRQVSQLLQSNDTNVRGNATSALGMIGNARAVEVLIAAINDLNSRVRGRAASALGMIGDARAVEHLIAALDDQKRYVRWRAASALVEISDQTLAEGLSKALQHKDSFTRRKAAEVIGYYVVENVIEPLSQLAASDPQMEVRQAAGESLGKIKRRLELTGAATP